MKKLLALILSGIMLFALSGCGGAKDLQQEAAAPAGDGSGCTGGRASVHDGRKPCGVLLGYRNNREIGRDNS